MSPAGRVGYVPWARAAGTKVPTGVGDATRVCAEASATRNDSRSLSVVARPAWLPGPIDVRGAMSTERVGASERFGVVGLAAARVGRIILDHGNGLRTVASLVVGTFAVIAEGTVDVDAATLIVEDRAGGVIERRPAWGTGLQSWDRRCYTDPAGTVVHGEAGTGDCRPAEPWQ